MRRSLPILLVGSALFIGCEDGPDQLFTPFEGDPGSQNGYEPQAEAWTQDGGKGFTSQGGDSIGRAKFCDEDERTNLIQTMIIKPIIPDVTVGGVPLWGPDNTPLPADSLLGHPDDGAFFCDPTGVYADAFTWGPTDELIVWFDQETRLVTGIMAYQQYLGTMNAEWTNGDGSKGTLKLQTRERILLDDVELDRYAGRADADTIDGAWMNTVNASKIYRAVRETFFDAAPFADDYNCFTEQTCNLIYTTSNESVPQDTFIWFPDSGFQIRMTPEGDLTFVYIEPVRSAPFENGGTISFGPDASSNVAFKFTSDLRQNCILDLGEDISWAEFQTRCVASGDERVINRVNYNVDTSRDAVSVEFNTINLKFLRRTLQNPVFQDGEQPNDEDKLYGISFSRSLAAPVAEFRAQTLAGLFKTNLEAHMKAAFVATGTTTQVTSHPFWTFTVDASNFTDDAPQRIGQLLDDDGVNFVPTVIAEVREMYRTLSREQKDMLDPKANDELYLLEAYTLALVQAFSHGNSLLPGTFNALYQTDDRRWSIATAHFLQNDIPQRVEVQYSLDFGGLSFVSADRGTSDIDTIVNIAKNQVGSTKPYFEFNDVLVGGHLLSLGGEDITVRSFDRQLATLRIGYSVGLGAPTQITVSGDPIQDLNGYSKQIRGERYEFVPSDVVRLYGKESIFLLYINEAGVTSRINMGTFKGPFTLCNGLQVRYGDDVKAALAAWERTVTPNKYRDCEIVFNYSENGNVLDSITSLANRRSVIVVNGRAATASAWQ